MRAKYGYKGHFLRQDFDLPVYSEFTGSEIPGRGRWEVITKVGYWFGGYNSHTKFFDTKQEAKDWINDFVEPCPADCDQCTDSKWEGQAEQRTKYIRDLITGVRS